MPEQVWEIGVSVWLYCKEN